MLFDRNFLKCQACDKSRPGMLYSHEATIHNPAVITHNALIQHNQAQSRINSAYHDVPRGIASQNPYSLVSPTQFPHSSSVAYSQHCISEGQRPFPHQASAAAASFFARTAQKLNLQSRKKRRHHHAELELEMPVFLTNFFDVLKTSPPPAPPGLLRSVGRKDVSGLGKVKVMLRVSPVPSSNDSSSSFLTIDTRKKQVTVFDPSTCGFVTPEDRRVGVAAPKMFAFDAIFSQDDSQTEVCSSSLTEVIQAVVNGSDGCLFSYGPGQLGKTYTMVGDSESVQALGIIPCAIAWLFKLINEEKQKTGARFSVRLSAVEVAGRDEVLKDLLAEHANGTENSGTSPGIYLREDPIFGAQLQNQSELRVPNVEKAAYYLDAALTARTSGEERNSHLLFTFHVYQYRVDKSGKGAVAGGRSRLHLLDLGSCEKQGNKGLSLSAIANVILAIFNGQKHVPYRDCKLTQLLREILGSISCRAAMIAHVSASLPNYAETLATIQFAARIHRLRRKKLKYPTSSGDSSGDDGRFRRHATSSDPDATSSSEQSCDTVIYIGENGLPVSDKELTDNEGPPQTLPLPHLNSTISQSKTEKPAAASVGKKQGPRTPLNDSRRVAARPSQLPRPTNTNHTTIPIKVKPGTALHSRDKCSAPADSVLLLNSRNGGQQFAQSNDLTQRVNPIEPIDNGERWVDGPRVRKSWIDTQTALPRKEMWVDGPQAVYGWMDQHKREMIRRWVELQSSHSQPFSAGDEIWVDGLSPVKNAQDFILRLESVSCKEPAVNGDAVLKQTSTSTHNDECNPTSYEQYVNWDCSAGEELCCLPCVDQSDVAEADRHAVNIRINKNGDTESQNQNGQSEKLLRVVQPTNSNHATLDSQQVKLNVANKLSQDTTSVSIPQCVDMPYNLFDDLSPREAPVMQDSCLQVNEEDIMSACYGIIEEHPLRILSEENLASSFADSFSLSAEMENLSLYASEDDDGSDAFSLHLETMSRFSVPVCYPHVSILQTVQKEGYPENGSTRSEPIKLEPRHVLASMHTNILYWSGLGHWKETITVQSCSKSKFPVSETQHLQDKGGSFNKEIAALRHPDGASNPSLDKLCRESLNGSIEEFPPNNEERSPGNGASNSDGDDKLDDEYLLLDQSCANNKVLNSRNQESTNKIKSEKENACDSGKTATSQDTVANKVALSSKDCPNGISRTSHSPVLVKGIPGKDPAAHNLKLNSCKVEVDDSHGCHHQDGSEQNATKIDLSCSSHITTGQSSEGSNCKNYDFKTTNMDSAEGAPLTPKDSSKTETMHQVSGTSSGYESMVRDSEGSGSSFSNAELVTDSSDDEGKRIQYGESNVIDNLHDVFELTVYDEEDVERIEKRRKMEENLALRHHHRIILKLRLRQEELRKELAASKRRLMIDADSWNYDLHVENSMEVNDPSFVEVLKQETQILEKRVLACKSRVMMITCFDSGKIPPDLDYESNSTD